MGQFTQPQATRNYTRAGMRVHPDGTLEVQLRITNQNGLPVDMIEIQQRAQCARQRAGRLA